MTAKRDFIYYTGFNTEKEIDKLHDDLAPTVDGKDFADGLFDLLVKVEKLNDKAVGQRYLASVVTYEDEEEGLINQFLVQRIDLKD